MAKKCALIGPHGTGKSTLAYGLSYILKMDNKNVELIAETARTSPLPVNEETTLDSQLWILVAQIKREIEAATRADFVICDRSVLDNYAYYSLAKKRIGLDTYTDPFPSLDELVKDWTYTYDLFLFIEPNTELKDDGFRSTSINFQKEVNREIKLLLNNYEIKTMNKKPTVMYFSASELLKENNIKGIMEALK